MIKMGMGVLALLMVLPVLCLAEPYGFEYESFPRNTRVLSDDGETMAPPVQGKISFAYTYPKGDLPCIVHFARNIFFSLNPKEKRDVICADWDRWFGDKFFLTVEVTFYSLLGQDTEYTIAGKNTLRIAKDYLNAPWAVVRVAAPIRFNSYARFDRPDR